MKKVFLGGTCNNSTWRNEFIKKLQIDYFEPCGDDWMPEMMEEEIKQRHLCDHCLYVITPKMTGVFSIAEVVDDSNKFPAKTIFCFLKQDGNDSFTSHQVKSLEQVARMVQDNGAKYFSTLDAIAAYLNEQ